MSRILITGAAGFIGSHLSKALEDQKHKLVLLDNFSRGKQEYLDYLGVETKCIYTNMTDYLSFKYFENVDVVYHLAAKIGGMQYLHGSSEKELSALQKNITIDKDVFKACMDYKVKKIIFASSVSVYNIDSQTAPNAFFSEEHLEKHPLCPDGGYGWAKYLGEKQLCLMKDCGIKTGVARLFKCYGPCDDTSEKSSNVVISNCKKAINYPREPFVVWGDGSATRDFFYIDDCIDGFLKIEKYLNDHKNITVNFGSGKPTQIKQIADEIVKISGKDIKVKYDKTKPTGPLSRTAIMNKTKKELGWEPKVKLSEGLKKTYDWVEECQSL